MMDEWSEKEKSIIRKLASERIQMKNPEKLADRIMMKIEQSSKRKTDALWLLKFAAGLAIILFVGSYAVQEGFTQYSRMNLQNSYLNQEIDVQDYDQCLGSLRFYLMVGDRFNSFLEVNSDTVFLSLADVHFLKDNYPDYHLRVDKFLQVMEKLYPAEYINYMSGGVMVLKVEELKHNDLLCNLLTQ